MFAKKLKQGSKLSSSYSVLAQKDIESGNACDSIPLGIISVDWKPASLTFLEGSIPILNEDEFGSSHGPLSVPLTPIIFHGPRCQVLDSPFTAKLLKCPATPKVGAPFCISYLVANKSAKNQTLVVRLNDEQVGKTATSSSRPQLLGSGKLKEEMEMAPFEEKIFSFTFISMLAGKVLRPSLNVYSIRHQTWVVNETRLSPRYLFVMP